jgi:predicted DNA-binding transcriptional regulator AlpA
MVKLQPVAEDGRDWQAQAVDPMLMVTLASGLTVKEAATRSGVSKRTAWRRLSDPAFPCCVAEAGR